MLDFCRTAFVAAAAFARNSYNNPSSSTSLFSSTTTRGRGTTSLNMSTQAPTEVGIKYPELVNITLIIKKFTCKSEQEMKNSSSHIMTAFFFLGCV